MKRKMFRLAICLLVIGNGSFAQWGGSTTIDGTAYRTGNVGIGTGNYVPFKLTVGTTQQGDGIFLGTSGTPSIGLLGNMTPGAWNPITQSGDNLLLWKGSNIDQSDAGGFVIAPWSNSTHGIRISQQGSVGINTSNPGHTLDVNGDINTNSNMYASGDVVLSGTGQPSGYVVRPNIAGYKNLSFSVQGGSPLDNLTLVSNLSYFTGNVGIGTTSIGSFKLAVEGKIAAREVQVTFETPFPDYVFNSNYKLRSLYNLEKFINQNKHLPGVPSASEVEKNGGFEVGKMNTTLLEKIEEQALYIIELNKKLDEINKKLEKLEKRAGK